MNLKASNGVTESRTNLGVLEADLDDIAVENGGSKTVKASLIATGVDFFNIRSDWNALFDRCGYDNVYLSHEWMYAWWNQWGESINLFIIAVRDNEDRLISIAPFCITSRRRLLSKSRALGFLSATNTCCDHLETLVERGFEREASEAIAAQLIFYRRQWTYVDLGHCSAGSIGMASLVNTLCSKGMNAHRIISEVCPYISLPGSYPEFLAGLSGSLRKNLRRYMRGLEQKGTVRVECVTEPERIDYAFEVLVQLHSLRFKDKIHPSSFLKPDLQAFHQSVLVPLARHGWVRIYLIHVGDRIVSALYGFRVGCRFFHYQAGMDPDWLRDGVGAVCIGAVIEDCIAHGVAEYDFLCGAEEYKFYWTRVMRQDCTFMLFDRRVGSQLEQARLSLITHLRHIKSRFERLRNAQSKKEVASAR